jgi:putative addiction module killer protein
LKKWQIHYWTNESGKSPIEKWLDKLTKEQFTYVAEELDILEQLGNNLKLPHSRALGKGLFELRERQFGYRLYYCFKENKIIILLAAGDKKSQEKDIKVAYKRLLEDE